MRTSFKPYSTHVLPEGFKYPKEYLELSTNLTLVSAIPYFPWWFEDCNDETIKEDIKILFNLTGQDNLISFARDGDWAACFDIYDFSGEPKVYVYDLGNRRNRYISTNFLAWLKQVIEETLADE